MEVDNGHVHQNNPKTSHLPLDTVEFVKKLISQERIKSNHTIKHRISDAKLTQLTIGQIKNLKARLKYKLLGKPSTDLTELLNWCKGHQVLPDDLDEIFCQITFASIN
jgi:superoxide dismutase